MHQDAGKVYRIVVRSGVSERDAAAFEGMETKGGLTDLEGKIIDQSHLYGMLDRLSGLGLGLLRVERSPEVRTEDDAENSPPMINWAYRKAPVGIFLPILPRLRTASI